MFALARHMAIPEQNLLLRSLPAESLARLSEQLIIQDLPTRTPLYSDGDAVTNVYFPLESVVSIVAHASGVVGEVATIGLEGMVGLSVVFGASRARQRAFLQVGGATGCLSSEQFADLLNTDAPLRAVILLYAEAAFLQIGQSVLCNQRHSLKQRCARWLLMTHDRVPGDQFHLTHEFLAIMLGVRRAGVTVVAGQLQRARLIRYRRGQITILDRAGLEAVSCECYQIVADNYDSLIGQPIDKSQAADADADAII